MLRGSQEAGTVRWLGIPYAAAPTGDLRWRAPRPPPPWQGLRDATRFAPDCMQAPVAADAAPIRTVPSEDCLYLNIWRPAAAGMDLPVIVWIHGGAFLTGGSSAAIHDGAALAGRGAVFVSLNYRLGRFGTFLHPALSRAEAPSGNFGLLDQIAALRWIREHIRAFGGDPGNVTLIGESAGGASVHYLMAAPGANGLFHRAAILSGMTGLRPGTATRPEMEAVGAAFARRHGIAGEGPEALAALRALPAEAVCGGLNWMTAADEAGQSWAGPWVDGRDLADPGPGAWAPIPVMIGATDDDLGGRTGYMIAGARRAADRLADAGHPVWSYRFAYLPESVAAAGAAGAGHASDVPFFLGTAARDPLIPAGPRDRAMAAAIGAHLFRFAQTGDPNGPGLPDWPRHRPGGDALMSFGRDGRGAAGPDPWAAEIDAAPPPRNPDPLGDLRGAG
ncbi:carboxylesterase family protein [Mangrovicoccus sp. HB182678]|uniref:Carboxylic ester hydrolase n=2 Tax=Mangrovicoccus algicola TaxID=2771008 RepID=A0A8J7CVU0_9RHOB|nr:carboxylesterase family protein [Mangrovicoccus algicola]